jgi:ABC-type nickel/cobalt efflux system permease component RcnA
VLSSRAFAHPMGSFSISHYSGLKFIEDEIVVDYVIDMAEIPSYQEMDHLDVNHDRKVTDAEKQKYAGSMAEKFTRYLRLNINGNPVQWKLRKSHMEIRPGAGELYTLVITATYAGKYPGELKEKNQVHFVDENFPMRTGWREISIDRNQNFASFNLKPEEYTDRSKQLTVYPQDQTTTMPQEMIADFSFERLEPGSAVASKSDQPGGFIFSRTGRGSRDDSFTRLIAAKDLTGKMIAISLLIAFFLGSMHALSPGHGKTIVAGYLIGSRGTAYHAVFLGAIVTLTHTIGVFALGLITLFGSRYILPERLYPWLGLFSGLAIVCIGGALFLKRYRSFKQRNQTHHHHHHSHHNHEHDHHHDDHYHHQDEDHSHDADHGHSHLPVDQTGKITWKSLLTVGISGGALPCPSALVVLLSAISLHRIGFGLLLIVAFSLGLALVLTSIGLLLVYASRFTQRFQFGGKFAYGLPLVSSFIITILGCAIAVQSLMQI